MKNRANKLRENGYNIDDPVFIAGSIDGNNKHLVKIESYTVLGEESYIITHSPTMTNDKFGSYGIILDKHSWVGFRCIILPGVKIRRTSIIGAGSVVTKSTCPFGIYAGNPAKFIKYRDYIEIVRTFVVRWLMGQILNGKHNPDYSLLTIEQLKDLFAVFDGPEDNGHPLCQVLNTYGSLEKFLEYLKSKK